VGQRQGAVAGPDQVGPEHDGQVRRRHLKKTRQKTVNPPRDWWKFQNVFFFLPTGRDQTPLPHSFVSV
jgi:hypothetical protein